jgi:hypothetical protein
MYFPALPVAIIILLYLSGAFCIDQNLSSTSRYYKHLSVTFSDLHGLSATFRVHQHPSFTSRLFQWPSASFCIYPEPDLEIILSLLGISAWLSNSFCRFLAKYKV